MPEHFDRQSAILIKPAEVRAWRKAGPAPDAPVTVVAGTYDLLHPGNLMAIRRAWAIGNRVCVLLCPDYGDGFPTPSITPLPARAEFISYLHDVNAVIPYHSTPGIIKSLTPFVLVDCLAQPATDALQRTLRKNAQSIVDIPPMDGCFTPDLITAIKQNNTPVKLPADYGMPRPTPSDLDRALQDREHATIVTINGCFDVLHIGHTRFLDQAQHMGDRLIVLINDDCSVRAYKGPTRPIFPAEFRLQVLNALRPVDFAYPFEENSPLALLSVIRPDIHVKGGTFEESRVRDEQDLLQTWGGRVEFCPMVNGFSTTRLIDQLTAKSSSP